MATLPEKSRKDLDVVLPRQVCIEIGKLCFRLVFAKWRKVLIEQHGYLYVRAELCEI